MKMKRIKREWATSFYASRALAFLCAFILSSATCANPVLESIAHGEVSIQQTPTTTTINQTSGQAIINWRSFDIGASEATHFNQPTNGVAFNRINPTQGASQIYGSLSATGQIILLNPAGIYFGPTARVNVGGLIASTGAMTDDDFLAGSYHINNIGSGEISNAGRIIAEQNGLVALIGGTVTNSGYIEANLGKIILASGDTYVMSFNGNELVSFDVGSEQSGLPRSVNNTGMLVANGGQVQLSAKTASSVLDNAINMQGVIQASSVGVRNGEIILNGGAGHVQVSGKIIASGKRSGERGGHVVITANKVTMNPTAAIDVTGDAGGGVVEIGGNYQGLGTLAHASDVTMSAGSVIDASAITNGDGGQVVLWSDDYTKAAGTIVSQGGALGGNGGFIETSSKHYLDVNGISVSTLAPSGLTGHWLLDPADLTITNVPPFQNVSGSSTFQPSAAGAMLDVGVLTAALGSNNVIVQTNNDGFLGNGDIFVNANINWASPFSLTLTAYRNITSSANITNTGGASVVLRADNTGTGVGTVSFTGGNHVTLSGGAGTVSIYYNPIIFGTPETIYSGGTTSVDYMLINQLGNESDTTTPSLASLSNLSYVNSSILQYNYALSKDIDATASNTWHGGNGFRSIGAKPPFGYPASFTGVFNGMNHVISNLSLHGTNYYSDGFFAINQGVIENIGLVNANLSSFNSNAIFGGLVGTNAGMIDNSYVSGNVSFDGNGGGLVGINDVGGIINNSHNDAFIVNVGGFGQRSGGLVAENNGGTISNSYNAGQIGSFVGSVGYGLTGGLVGVFDSGTLLNVTNQADVYGGSSFYLGGIVGQSYGGSIINAINTGNIYGSTQVGGIVGSSASSIDQSANYGIISGRFPVGGIAGENAGVISNSFNAGQVIGASPGGFYGTGGIAGTNDSVIINSYNAASGVVQSAGNNVGGVTGVNNALVEQSFNLGSVFGNNNVGGIAGSNGDGQNAGGTILRSENLGSVTGTGYGAGGIVGYNYHGYYYYFNLNYDSFVKESANIGVVNGNSAVGGIAGANTSYISNSYSLGAVFGNDQVGGAIGFSGANNLQFSSATNLLAAGFTQGNTNVGGLIGLDGGVTVQDSFWNVQTTGQYTSAGSYSDQYYQGNPGYAWMTTNQMMQTENFTNTGRGFVNYEWDFSTPVWGMSNGQTYPFLVNVNGANPIVLTGQPDLSVGNALPGGTQVALSQNGSNVGFNNQLGGTYGTINAGFDGSFYFIEPGNSIQSGDVLMAYSTDVSHSANTIMKMPTTTNAINNFYLVDRKFIANSNPGDPQLANSDLALAATNLSSQYLLYENPQGNQINWKSNTDLVVIDPDGFLMDGNTILQGGNMLLNGRLIMGDQTVIAGQLIGGTMFAVNTLDYHLYSTPVTVDLTGAGTSTATGGITGVRDFVGGVAGDLLIGENVANTWNMTANHSGNVVSTNNTTTFSSFENLTGGIANDHFVFTDGVSLAGVIDGGAGGVNTADFSSYTAPLSVVLNASSPFGYGGNVASVTGLSNITTLIGGSGMNSLTGINANSQWTITGQNQGGYHSGSGVSLLFYNFANLFGGAGNDYVTFTPLAKVDGVANGGDGNDIFDYSEFSSPISVIMSDLKSGSGTTYNDKVFSSARSNPQNPVSNFAFVETVIGNGLGYFLVPPGTENQIVLTSGRIVGGELVANGYVVDPINFQQFLFSLTTLPLSPGQVSGFVTDASGSLYQDNNNSLYSLMSIYNLIDMTRMGRVFLPFDKFGCY